MTPSRKQHQRHRQRARTKKGESRPGSTIDAAAEIAHWRNVTRMDALSDFLKQTDGLKWTKTLFLVLLEELYISDEFDQIIGPPENLPAKRWPQAVALGIALRHSWLPNDLTDMASRLGLGHRSRTSAR